MKILKIFLIGLVSALTLYFAYVTFYSKYIVKRHPYTFSLSVRETKDTLKELRSELKQNPKATLADLNEKLRLSRADNLAVWRGLEHYQKVFLSSDPSKPSTGGFVFMKDLNQISLNYPDYKDTELNKLKNRPEFKDVIKLFEETSPSDLQSTYWEDNPLNW